MEVHQTIAVAPLAPGATSKRAYRINMGSDSDSDLHRTAFGAMIKESRLSLPRARTLRSDLSQQLESTSGNRQQQLAIDVLERHYQVESEINEDRIRFLSSKMASESEAAKQTLRMTLEETEMRHAHELRCMALHNEIA